MSSFFGKIKTLRNKDATGQEKIKAYKGIAQRISDIVENMFLSGIIICSATAGYLGLKYSGIEELLWESAQEKRIEALYQEGYAPETLDAVCELEAKQLAEQYTERACKIAQQSFIEGKLTADFFAGNNMIKHLGTIFTGKPWLRAFTPQILAFPYTEEGGPPANQRRFHPYRGKNGPAALLQTGRMAYLADIVEKEDGHVVFKNHRKLPLPGMENIKILFYAYAPEEKYTLFDIAYINREGSVYQYIIPDNQDAEFKIIEYSGSLSYMARANIDRNWPSGFGLYNWNDTLVVQYGAKQFILGTLPPGSKNITRMIMPSGKAKIFIEAAEDLVVLDEEIVLLPRALDTATAETYRRRKK